MQLFKSWLGILGYLVLSVSFLFAQDDTIKVDTNLVNIGVLVKNKNGSFVKNLKKEDFQVFDNNEKQEIEIFSGEDEPISLGIVYDLHPTTSVRSKVVLNSLRSFSKELPSNNDIFSIVFNERGSLQTDFVPTIEQVDTFIINGSPTKPNSLFDAVFAASEKIREKKNQKKMLLIISDGKDHSSHHSFSELSKLLRSFNVQIYSIILDNAERWGYSDITFHRQRIRNDNSFLDQANLKDLSDKSGGSSENPFSDSEKVLTGIYQQMINEMRQQYSIGFYPKVLDGKRRKLKVNVNTSPKQKLAVVYRKDYQSTKK